MLKQSIKLPERRLRRLRFPQRGLESLFVRVSAQELSGWGVAGQEQAPLRRVAEDATRLETGEERGSSLLTILLQSD